MPHRVDLDAMEKLHAAATQGEWLAVMNHVYCEIRVEDGQIGDMCASLNQTEGKPDDIELSEANAKLAVAAVNAMPALIRELRELRELVGCATRFQVGRCTVLLTGGGFWWRLIAPGYEDLFDSSYKALAAARQWEETHAV